MEDKKFSKLDEEFICKNCGKKVKKLGYTSRDHCPFCLFSIHIDINPGDRKNSCHGMLKPIDIEINSKKGNVIIYKCEKCGCIKKNIVASDDDYDKILEIMKSKQYRN